MVTSHRVAVFDFFCFCEFFGLLEKTYFVKFFYMYRSLLCKNCSIKENIFVTKKFQLNNKFLKITKRKHVLTKKVYSHIKAVN